MPLLAPSGSTITLIIQTDALGVNGSTEIIAIVIEGEQQTSGGTGAGGATTPGVGNPVHNGTLVTFTTSLGRIEPVQARTTGGKATVTLFGDGRSGTATINAFSGVATANKTVKIGAAAASRIQVTAAPQALPASGGAATISARVEDAQANPLTSVAVSFSTDVGTLSAQTVVTDANGVAATTLTTTTGPATVTATVGNGTTNAVTGNVKVTVKPRNTPTLTVPTGTMTQSVPAVFTVGLTAGSVVTNVVLSLGDGTVVNLGAITSATTFTYIYGDDGAYTVTATAIDADGVQTAASAGIYVVPLGLSGAASPTSAATNVAITFTATPSAAGVAVDHYEFDFGDGTPVVSTSSNQQAHAFTTSGTKTVIVKLVPAKGHTKSVQIVVTIT